MAKQALPPVGRNMELCRRQLGLSAAEVSPRAEPGARLEGGEAQRDSSVQERVGVAHLPGMGGCESALAEPRQSVDEHRPTRTRGAQHGCPQIIAACV